MSRGARSLGAPPNARLGSNVTSCAIYELPITPTRRVSGTLPCTEPALPQRPDLLDLVAQRFERQEIRLRRQPAERRHDAVVFIPEHAYPAHRVDRREVIVP